MGRHQKVNPGRWAGKVLPGSKIEDENGDHSTIRGREPVWAQPVVATGVVGASSTNTARQLVVRNGT